MPSLPSVAEQHTRGHLKPLDGVRGLAILMVIISHAFQSNLDGKGGFAHLLGTLFGYGAFGVDLFFVLSGFLITGILVDSVDKKAFFKTFYMRRVLRIFPLYYAVLLGLFLLTPVLHLEWRGMGWLMLGYLQNLRPAQVASFSPGTGLQLNHFWSLAVEEQFYLVWPAVVFFMRDRKQLFWTTLAISGLALALRLGLAFAGVGALAVHVTTFTRADSLLLGGALSLLYRSEYWSKVQRFAPWGSLAAAGVILGSIVLLEGYASAYPSTSLGARLWIDGLRYTVLALGASCLIACSLRPGSICAWIFEQSWLRFFGRYSYGIYVLHMVALPFLVNRQRAAIFSATHSKMLAVAGAGLSALMLSVIAAYFSFHLFEKPFLHLKHYFDYEEVAPAPLPAGPSARRRAEVHAA